MNRCSPPRSARRRTLGVLVLAVLGVVFLTAFAAAPDVVRLRPGGRHPPRLPVAVFSHQAHPSISCYGCHPQLFDAQRRPVTHRDMQRGLACGACHDGSLAAPVRAMDCRACHVR